MMRNQRIDLFKCVAVYSVVLLHIKPGPLAWPVTGLTRFAVPYFFLVAGYFACGQRESKLLRRAGHALGLWCAGMGLVFALCAAMILRHPGWSVWGGISQQFTPQAWLELLLFQVVPFPYGYHLWYIGSVPLLYLIWWAVTWLCRRAGREIPYRLLAVAAVMLLGVHLALEEGLALLGRTSLPAQFLRNAWFDGLPFFLLGVWMHYDQAKLTSMLHGNVIAGGIILGGVLALAEQYKAGYQDLFVGSILTAVLLLAAALKWPDVNQGPVRRWMCFCGSKLTFTIYVLHVPLYYFFCEWNYVPPLGWIVDHRLITGVTVALLCTLAALAVQWCKDRKPV